MSIVILMIHECGWFYSFRKAPNGYSEIIFIIRLPSLYYRSNMPHATYPEYKVGMLYIRIAHSIEFFIKNMKGCVDCDS